jgi:hypothetical protein
MRPKNFIKANNLFKQQHLTYLTYVLCKISVMKYSFEVLMGQTNDRRNYINSLEIMCSFDGKNIENFKQLV